MLKARNPNVIASTAAEQTHERRSRQGFRLVDEPRVFSSVNRSDPEKVVSQVNVDRDSPRSNASVGLRPILTTTNRMHTPDGFDRRRQWPPEETMFGTQDTTEYREEERAVGERC